MKEALAESGARPAAPAIEEIIDNYGREIWYLCLMYLKDRHLAEDAFQITLTRVWRKLDTFQGKSALKTWIMQIAANTWDSMNFMIPIPFGPLAHGRRNALKHMNL